MQPSEKPSCPLRQIETDSERKRCSRRETERRKRQTWTNSCRTRKRRGGWEYLESDAVKGTVSEKCIYIKSEKWNWTYREKGGGKKCAQWRQRNRKRGRGRQKQRDLELDADRKRGREKWRVTGREKNVIGCRQRNRAGEESVITSLHAVKDAYRFS